MTLSNRRPLLVRRANWFLRIFRVPSASKKSKAAAMVLNLNRRRVGSRWGKQLAKGRCKLLSWQYVNIWKLPVFCWIMSVLNVKELWQLYEDLWRFMNEERMNITMHIYSTWFFVLLLDRFNPSWFHFCCTEHVWKTRKMLAAAGCSLIILKKFGKASEWSKSAIRTKKGPMLGFN